VRIVLGDFFSAPQMQVETADHRLERAGVQVALVTPADLLLGDVP
jgi:hypothetical protein